jgi:hypothetical protein
VNCLGAQSTICVQSDTGSPLFPAAVRKTGKLSRRPLVRTDAADMLKRGLKQAGLPAHYSPHSFRATGITNFLENDGTLEALKPLSESPVTPTAEPQNSMIAATRRFCSRTWRECRARHFFPNVEYGKMRSKPDECALGLRLRVTHSAFYFIRAKQRMSAACRRV